MGQDGSGRQGAPPSAPGGREEEGSQPLWPGAATPAMRPQRFARPIRAGLNAAGYSSRLPLQPAARGRRAFSPPPVPAGRARRGRICYFPCAFAPMQ